MGGYESLSVGTETELRFSARAVHVDHALNCWVISPVNCWVISPVSRVNIFWFPVSVSSSDTSTANRTHVSAKADRRSHRGRGAGPPSAGSLYGWLLSSWTLRGPGWEPVEVARAFLPQVSCRDSETKATFLPNNALHLRRGALGTLGKENRICLNANTSACSFSLNIPLSMLFLFHATGEENSIVCYGSSYGHILCLCFLCLHSRELSL